MHGQLMRWVNGQEWCVLFGSSTSLALSFLQKSWWEARSRPLTSSHFNFWWILGQLTGIKWLIYFLDIKFLCKLPQFSSQIPRKTDGYFFQLSQELYATLKISHISIVVDKKTSCCSTKITNEENMLYGYLHP